MKSILKYILKITGYDQIGVLYGYLMKSGWLTSVRSKKSVDSSGLPLPWYSYPCIYFLNQCLGAPSEPRRAWSVFEFGSGSSTLWWAQKVERVVSVEDNRQWYDYVTQKKTPNVTYKYAENKNEYMAALTEELGLFEIIIIDGSLRDECVQESVLKLTLDGVLIVDNSDWENLRASLSFLKEAGFRRLEFYGLGPMNGHPWGTSILYRDGNVFKI